MPYPWGLWSCTMCSLGVWGVIVTCRPWRITRNVVSISRSWNPGRMDERGWTSAAAGCDGVEWHSRVLFVIRTRTVPMISGSKRGCWVRGHYRVLFRPEREEFLINVVRFQAWLLGAMVLPSAIRVSRSRADGRARLSAMVLPSAVRVRTLTVPMIGIEELKARGTLSRRWQWIG